MFQMKLNEIDSLHQKLSSMHPLNETEMKRLREEFMIESNYNSNAIEGSTLTLRETALILQEGLTIAQKPIREHLDVIGYRDAFDLMIALAEKDEPLTERTIKDIHSLVLMNDPQNRGVYRGVPVRIMGAEHTPLIFCETVRCVTPDATPVTVNTVPSSDCLTSIRSYVGITPAPLA